MRTNAHYLNFIEVITFYKQYQREVKEDPNTGLTYIETTLEDIQEANALLKEVLLAKSDELSKGCRTYFETNKRHLFEEQKLSFYRSDVRNWIRINPHNLKYHLFQFLKTVGGNRYNQGLESEVTGYGHYTTLNSQVINTLDIAFDRLSKSVDSSG